MNGRRAEEIMESYGVIEVSYKGSSVWLEGIKGEIAEVSFIETGKRAEVPLNILTEDR